MCWNIYVDGSYHLSSDRAAYAYAIVRYDICFFQDYGIVPDAQGTQNIAGEVMAVQKALQHVLPACVDPIMIHYDFTGIESWATGKWNCNNEITRTYRDFIKNVMEIHDISFTKIRSHSGNPWNDHVDRLARRAFIGEQTLTG